jgi:hypothetical protein
MKHTKLILSPVLRRYLMARATIQRGMETGRVDIIKGQNWLDINEARMKGAR